MTYNRYVLAITTYVYILESYPANPLAHQESGDSGTVHGNQLAHQESGDSGIVLQRVFINVEQLLLSSNMV